jgi:hypothetical protein
MRFILVFCLTVVCVLPTNAAVPQKPPADAAAPQKASAAKSVSINIKTANDLADACTITPNSKDSFARLNFCNGFAQGAIQTNGQNPSGSKICFPARSPKRSETMKEFASWVRADASRKDDLASIAFLKFMVGRYPCN